MDSKIAKQNERAALESRLAGRGFEFIYGGTKGHGWWIRGFGWVSARQVALRIERADF